MLNSKNKLKTFFKNLFEIDSINIPAPTGQLAQDELKELIQNEIKANTHNGLLYNHYSGGAKFKNALLAPKRVQLDRPTLLLRGKEEKFKSGIYNSMVYWLMVYTIGTGYALNSTPLWDMLGVEDTKARAKTRKDIENLIKLIFSSNTIDYSGNMPTWQLFRELFKTYLESGDMFILFHYYTDDSFNPIKLQVIPTERVKTPYDKIGDKNIIDGIEYDKNGREIAYWIENNVKEDSSTLRFNTELPKYTRIEKKTKLNQTQVIHLAIRNEINDSRGIPLAIDPLVKLCLKL